MSRWIQISLAPMHYGLVSKFLTPHFLSISVPREKDKDILHKSVVVALHYAPWWVLIFWGFWSRSFILVREMRIQCIFEEKIDIIRNIWKRCSKLETQFYIEWKNKTKNGHLEVIEQVRAGQLADMWCFAMPFGFQNLVPNILHNHAHFKYDVSNT